MCQHHYGTGHTRRWDRLLARLSPTITAPSRLLGCWRRFGRRRLSCRFRLGRTLLDLRLGFPKGRHQIVVQVRRNGDSLTRRLPFTVVVLIEVPDVEIVTITKLRDANVNSIPLSLVDRFHQQLVCRNGLFGHVPSLMRVIDDLRVCWLLRASGSP